MPNEEQGLAASLFQTSFQVGGALVLAIVTAVVDANGGAGRAAPAATLAAYRPALFLITGVAAVGASSHSPGCGAAVRPPLTRQPLTRCPPARCRPARQR
jgi:hypothetical protein